MLWVYAMAAVLLGDSVAWTAYTASPALVPALIGLTILAALSLSRPEIGVAVLLAAVTVGRLGVLTNAVAILALAGSIGLAIVAVRLNSDARSRRVGMPPLTFPVAVYLVAVLVAAVESDDAVVARRLVRAALTGVAIFVATSLSVRARRNLLPLILAAGLAVLAVGGRAVVEYRAGGGTDVGFATTTGAIVGRATAGFSQPNQLAGFLVVVIPLAIGGAMLFPQLRVGLGLAALIGAAGVYTSFSRAGLAALLIVPVIFLRRRYMLVVPVVAAGLAVLGPGLLTERFATLTTGGAEVSTRVDYWRAAVAIWGDHPFTGIGLGGYPDGYAALPLPGRQFLPTTVLEPPPHAHNVFLNVLAEEGLLGFAALAGLLGAALRLAWRLARSREAHRRVAGTMALATLIAFIVHNLADVTLFETETALFVWVVLGMISGLSWPSAETPERR